MPDLFNAVYYAAPVPSSWHSLTQLSLIFDKIYFPGVYIPEAGIDRKETEKEINRIKNLGENGIETVQMLNCMVYALWAKNLKNFCVFTGKHGCAGTLENGANELANSIEEAIFGPPPPNFIPTFPSGFVKGLPGEKEASVNGPSWITYPANALIFSAKNDLLLVSDNPNLPVIGVGNASFKSNAKALATMLAIESVKLILPRVRALRPPDIEEFREQTSDIISPFRMSMLKLSKDLNTIITEDTPIEDVAREAKFIAETKILPELEELRRIIEEPASPWYKHAIDLTASAPELAGNFSQMPPSMAFARVLAKFAEALGGVRNAQVIKEKKIKQADYHYLLKIEDRMAG
jgi:hypothetical protein